MGFDLSIKAASIEDAVSSLDSAVEMLEGCDCEDEMDLLSDVMIRLHEKQEAIEAQLSREAQETTDELTRLYYRER